ncbi:MAG: hypothetical protein WBG86_21070 [Polyangiales bacterium]
MGIWTRLVWALPLLATLVFAPLTADGCDRDDSVGDNIEDAAEEVGDDIEDATD